MELTDLPVKLMTRAFVCGEEAAWPLDQALDVVHYVADSGVVVLGGEVWLRGSGAPRTPKPLVVPYTWATADRRQGESHGDCVERARREAVSSIKQFALAGDLAERFGDEEPLFNLTF